MQGIQKWWRSCKSLNADAMQEGGMRSISLHLLTAKMRFWVRRSAILRRITSAAAEPRRSHPPIPRSFGRTAGLIGSQEIRSRTRKKKGGSASAHLGGGKVGETARFPVRLPPGLRAGGSLAVSPSSLIRVIRLLGRRVCSRDQRTCIKVKFQMETRALTQR